jgi:hypothetical protein
MTAIVEGHFHIVVLFTIDIVQVRWWTPIVIAWCLILLEMTERVWIACFIGYVQEAQVGTSKHVRVIVAMQSARFNELVWVVQGGIGGCYCNVLLDAEVGVVATECDIVALDEGGETESECLVDDGVDVLSIRCLTSSNVHGTLHSS